MSQVPEVKMGSEVRDGMRILWQVPIQMDDGLVLPAGWRVALTVRGKDYGYEGEVSEFEKKFYYATRGTGGMTHADPDDRPKDVFGGRVTLHTGGSRESYLLVPIIPR